MTAPLYGTAVRRASRSTSALMMALSAERESGKVRTSRLRMEDSLRSCQRAKMEVAMMALERRVMREAMAAMAWRSAAVAGAAEG